MPNQTSIDIRFQYQSHCLDVDEIDRLNQSSLSIPIHVWTSISWHLFLTVFLLLSTSGTPVVVLTRAPGTSPEKAPSRADLPRAAHTSPKKAILSIRGGAQSGEGRPLPPTMRKERAVGHEEEGATSHEEGAVAHLPLVEQA
jgi:hypothetical protein